MTSKSFRLEREVVGQYLKEVLPKLSAKDIELVLDAYSEHWRTYHNIGHIFNMIKNAIQHFRHLCNDEEWRALLTMILYHDVVYKVGEKAADNERASADLMSDHLDTFPSPTWFGVCVWAGIFATKSHGLEGVPEQYRKIVAMLIDLDLIGLGLSETEFKENTEAIWLEFQPVTTRHEYDRGRERWARSFLERPKIYLTDIFYDLFEKQARKNLEQLLQN